MVDGTDPCQLFLDNVDQKGAELEAAIAAFILATNDLIACREEHPENPPPPMAPMHSDTTQQTYSHKYKMAFAARLVDMVKTFRKMIR